MISNAKKVSRWRENTKKRMIDSMGGECVCCGYKECMAAMDFHHIEMDKKEIGIARMLANPSSWEKIVKELRKCVLVCNRCHQEIHAGVRVLPDKHETFNEAFEFKEQKKKKKTYCPVCGEVKNNYSKTCSYNCVAKLNGKVDWESFDLKELLEEHNMNYTRVGKCLKVSDNAVRKRAKKIGLI